MATRDSIAVLTIGGVDYECREFTYSANVLRLADAFSARIPAPDGRVRAADGGQVPASRVATMGARVSLAIADPEVDGGARVPKLVGVVTGRMLRADPQQGTVLQVTGADLGWQLSSCGMVYTSTRGVLWTDWLRRVVGLTIDPATGRTLTDELGWGFVGVRGGNFLNRRTKLGRQAVEFDLSDRQLEQSVPVFHVEVGETLDSLMIRFAKLDRFLLNVSADGWLQFFQPHYGTQVRYRFHHHPRSDPRHVHNNVISPSLQESADSLYTDVQCWSSTVDEDERDPTDPAVGRFYGSFQDSSTLPSYRLLTFTDTEQMSQERVTRRARWQWERGVFDSWTYTFDAVGHSQGGVPFVEDTMCELHDSVYGVEGLYYVSAVEPRRQLARPGVDSAAGTRTRITLKRPNLLAA